MQLSQMVEHRFFKWNNTDRLETTTSGVTVTGTVAATSYTGDGSQLTGIGAGINN